MLSVKGLTWGSTEFTRVAKLGEEMYERLNAVCCECEEDDEL
jgi:hypothetical protein